MTVATFCYGDSVEVRHASCEARQRGIVVGGKYDPQTFLVHFDHGEKSWHPASRMRHCYQAPKVQR